jgi:DNA polymerase sigma
MNDVVAVYAKVPIGRLFMWIFYYKTYNPSMSQVKFVDNVTDIHCDININEQFGIRNSRLLRVRNALFPWLL